MKKKTQNLKMLVHWACPPLLLGNSLPPSEEVYFCLLEDESPRSVRTLSFQIILVNVRTEAEGIQLRSILDQVSAELTWTRRLNLANPHSHYR